MNWNGSQLRLILVVAGGLIFLQSNSTTGKIAYALFLVVTAGISWDAYARAAKLNPVIAQFKTLMRGCLAVFLLAAISLPISIVNGAAYTSWFRAILTYVMLVTLPVIGIAAALDTPPRRIKQILFVVGIIAPLAFLTDWLDRRGVSALPVGRVLYASIPLCALMFAFSLGKLSEWKHPWRWILWTGFAPLCVVLTGTRSGLALIGGILGAIALFEARKKVRLHLGVAVIIAGTAAWAAVQVIPLIGSRIVDDPTFYERRLRSLDYFLSGRVAGDQSYLARQYQTNTVWEVFNRHMFFGEGIGVPHPTIGTFDTPVAPLAYFGMFGALMLSVYVVCWIITCVNLYRMTGPSAAMTTARVFLIAMLTYLPLSSVFDDKGISIAVCLLAALVASSALSRQEAEQVNSATMTIRPGRRSDPIPT